MMKRISRSKAPGNKRYPGGNKEGKTVGVLLTVRRDKAAALRFVDKAMKAPVACPKRSRWAGEGPASAGHDDIKDRG
jgi:putative transposase